MYTSGHTEICDEAFKLLSQRLRKNFLDDYPDYKDVSIKSLLTGLKYPDFPCGKYKFVKGRIQMTKNLCSILKLIDDIVFIPNLYSISYSSHNGYYSIWHAMTYNPNRTVFETTRDIVDHIMALCKLAIMDETLDEPGPNSFWLGFALHTIMDSYSPAHTFREDSIVGINYDTYIAKQLEVVDSKSIKPKMRREIDYVKEIKDRISKTEEEEDVTEFTETFIRDKQINKQTVKKDITQLAHFFFFHQQQLKEINKIRSIVAKSAKTKVGYMPLDDQVYNRISKQQNIINYYYYPSQPSFFHKQNDLISSVKKYRLYDQCILDTYIILRIYQEALVLLKNASTRIQILEVIYLYLHKIYKYLINKTFKIHPDCFTLKTGII